MRRLVISTLAALGVVAALIATLLIGRDPEPPTFPVTPASPTVRPFGIRGELARTLRPGAGGPLNVVLTNPHRFDVRIRSLVVGLRARTTRAGCSGTGNYAITQFRGRYPLALEPGSTALSTLRPDSATWPRVAMRDLPVNQDACRGARLSLTYRAKATR
jgi:hypothetical protein